MILVRRRKMRLKLSSDTLGLSQSSKSYYKRALSCCLGAGQGGYLLSLQPTCMRKDAVRLTDLCTEDVHRHCDRMSGAEESEPRRMDTARRLEICGHVSGVVARMSRGSIARPSTSTAQHPSSPFPSSSLFSTTTDCSPRLPFSPFLTSQVSV